MRVRVKRGYPLENCPKIEESGLLAAVSLAYRKGTVLYPEVDDLETLGYSVLVEFDEHVGGHDGGRGLKAPKGKPGHCWWIKTTYLEELPETPQLELTSEQIDRLDEMYNAVYDTVRVLVEDENLEWRMSIIGDVTDAIICELRGHRLRVRYPGIVEDADGTQHYEEYGDYDMLEDPDMRKVVLCEHCVLRNKMGCPSAELDEGQWRTMSCMEYCSAGMTKSEAVTRE